MPALKARETGEAAPSGAQPATWLTSAPARSSRRTTRSLPAAHADSWARFCGYV
jgi:hypothetical protein